MVALLFKIENFKIRSETSAKIYKTLNLFLQKLNTVENNLHQLKMPQNRLELVQTNLHNANGQV